MSKAFENFLQNREIIAQRLEAKYSQMTYPSAGFISEKGIREMISRLGQLETKNVVARQKRYIKLLQQ